MRVTVRLFAILRDAAGVGEFELDVAERATICEAASAIGSAHPSLAPYLPRVAYALNQSYASKETTLNDGDELALIPPVSGG